MTQAEAINILKLGHTTFLTGGAGTGKTYVLNQFIKYMQAHSIMHAVTASTGIAATHIGGTTIHSFSGIGIKDKITDWDLENMSQNEKLNKRILSTKVLIIDEISMLHASRVDMLDKILKSVRKNQEPFGGMQVIFCGDFFQLPPVVKSNRAEMANKERETQNMLAEKDWDDMNDSEKKEIYNKTDQNTKNEYAFNSRAWQNAKPVMCYLMENYRQDDNTLTNILNMIRSASEDIYDSLEALNDTKENELISPIRLYSHNRDVDTVNAKNYKELKSDVEHEYVMVGKGKKNLVDSLKQNILAPEILKLKLGTKVMFIKNEKTGKYQNGTLGIVDGFDIDRYPIVLLHNKEKIIAREDMWQIKDDNDAVLAEVSQIPLRYAWAITVHKSQGMTLDEAEIDLSSGFGYGMGYVALSRVRSLSGLKLHGLNNQALMVASHVLEYDKILKEKSKQAKSAITKYDEQELENLHKKTRVKMGGTEESLTDDQIKIKSEENNKKIKDLKDKNNTPTQTITLQLILQNKSLDEICKERELKINTILEHVCDIASLPEFKNLEKESNLKDTNSQNTEDKTSLKYKINSILESELEKFYKKNSYTKEQLENKKLHKDFMNLKTKTNQNNFIKEVKKDLESNEKMKPIFEKYSKMYSGIDYNILKIIKVI